MGGLPPWKIGGWGVSARKMHLLALKLDFFKRFKTNFHCGATFSLKLIIFIEILILKTHFPPSAPLSSQSFDIKHYQILYKKFQWGKFLPGGGD